MICVYSPDCTDFSTNGLGLLMPKSCEVTETLNGEYELTLEHPYDEAGKWGRLMEGNILRVPVPSAVTPRVSISVAGEDTRKELYRINTNVDAASVRGGTLRLRTGPGFDYSTLIQYTNGTLVQVMAKTNTAWYEVVAPDGKHGYMDTRFLQYERTEGTYVQATQSVVEARTLREQPFRIYKVEPSLTGIKAYARHVFYDLMDNMIKNVQPANSDSGVIAVQKLKQGCLSGHPFSFFSDIADTATDVKWENVNPIDAMLGENGFTEKYSAELMRDWYDVFLVRRVGEDTDIHIREGKNLLGITYGIDETDVVTRIMPTGEDADGNILYLPEVYVDSVNVSKYTHPKWIHLTVNDAKEVIDGDEPKSKDACYAEMRQAVQKEFDGGCDLPTVTLDVDFVNVCDVEEYAQYAPLRNIYLGDAVRVEVPRIGVDVSMRMTQYSYDCLTRKYTSMTLGTVADTVESNLISLRQIASGSITGAKLAINSVGTGHLQNGSVGSLQIKNAAIETAHIQDAAITRAKIAEASIGSAQIDVATIKATHIANAAIQETHIAEAAITRTKIANAAIDTAQIDDAAITRAKISDAAIGTAQIDDAAITEAKIDDAAITTAKIRNAQVDYANIADLHTESAYVGQAIIEQGVGGQLFIARLAVAYAQMVNATVGNLIIQASNGQYYELDVDNITGAITANPCTVSETEAAAGHTNTGNVILETNIVAETLSTTNIFGTYALLSQIDAARIDVDQLFAREAVIQQLNTADISNNETIKLAVQKTGYRMVYEQFSEPTGDIQIGDLWIKPLGVTWREFGRKLWFETQDTRWNEMVQYTVTYCWSGSAWIEMANTQAFAEDHAQLLLTQSSIEAEVTRAMGAEGTLASSIKQTADEIRSEVKAVDIGGENLLDDSSDTKNLISTSSGDYIADAVLTTYGSADENQWCRLTDGTGSTRAKAMTRYRIPVEPNTRYVFSADVRDHGNPLRLCIFPMTANFEYAGYDVSAYVGDDAAADFKLSGSNTQRVYVAATTAANVAYVELFIQKERTAGSDAFFDTRKWQFEYGNRPTAWSESTTQLSSRIEQTTDMISSEIVRATDQEAALSSRIEQSAVEIRSEVEAIQVGGENLITGTSNMNSLLSASSGDYIADATKVTIAGEGPNTWCRFTDGPGSTMAKAVIWSNYEVEAGKEYTFSAEVRDWGNPMAICMFTMTATGEYTGTMHRAVVGDGTNAQFAPLSGKPHRISVTGAMPENCGLVQLFVQKEGTAQSIKYFDTRKWKLEKGNKATDWSENTSELASNISQTAEKITSEVSRAQNAESLLSTKINQTAENIRLEANNLYYGKRSVVDIDPEGIKIKSTGTLEIASGGDFTVASGGSIQISTDQSTDSFISLGSGNFNASYTGGITGRNASFEACKVGGYDVITFGNLGTWFHVGVGQPASGKGTIWFKPSALTTVNYSGPTLDSRNGNCYLSDGGEVPFVLKAGNSNDILIGNASITYTISFPIVQIISGAQSNLLVYARISKAGETSQYVSFDPYTVNSMAVWEEKTITLTAVTTTNLCSTSSDIDVAIWVRKASGNLYVQSNSVITLSAKMTNTGAVTQPCEVYYVP